jgi:hypothetical protein
VVPRSRLGNDSSGKAFCTKVANWMKQQGYAWKLTDPVIVNSIRKSPRLIQEREALRSGLELRRGEIDLLLVDTECQLLSAVNRDEVTTLEGLGIKVVPAERFLRSW